MDGVLAAAGVMRRYLRSMHGGTTILMYHRVLPDAQCNDYPLHELAVPLSVFEAQMRWLAKYCDVRTVHDAVINPAPLNGKPVVCVSFDDGYRDNYVHAASVLERNKLRGTFFVTAGHVSKSDGDAPKMFWFDRAALHWQRQSAQALAAALDHGGVHVEETSVTPLNRWMEQLKAMPPSRVDAVLDLLDGAVDLTDAKETYATMTHDQLADLHRRGHEIGSHTMTHPILTHLEDDELAQELTLSRQLIAKWTNFSPVGLCYPNGDHDERVVNAAAAAGYAYACTTIPGLNAAASAPMRLRRQAVFAKSVTGWNGQHSDWAFSAEISGLHDRMRGTLKRV
jgi:peptidoglycan/xylan/chitin deacetylase (PgdA/CDA1 family)